MLRFKSWPHHLSVISIVSWAHTEGSPWSFLRLQQITNKFRGSALCLAAGSRVTVSRCRPTLTKQGGKVMLRSADQTVRVSRLSRVRVEQCRVLSFHFARVTRTNTPGELRSPSAHTLTHFTPDTLRTDLPRWLSWLRQCAPTGTVCRWNRGSIPRVGR